MVSHRYSNWPRNRAGNGRSCTGTSKAIELGGAGSTYSSACYDTIRDYRIYRWTGYGLDFFIEGSAYEKNSTGIITFTNYQLIHLLKH